jgi:hypothetical protein
MRQGSNHITPEGALSLRVDSGFAPMDVSVIAARCAIHTAVDEKKMFYLRENSC